MMPHLRPRPAWEDRYPVDEIAVWLGGTIPDPPSPPPNPAAYIAELEAEVAFARREYRERLARTLGAVLQEVQR